MKFHLLKFLWFRMNPSLRQEIILDTLTPDLAKEWVGRKPLHDAMQFLSEAVKSVSKGKQGIYHKPFTVHPRETNHA